MKNKISRLVADVRENVAASKIAPYAIGAGAGVVATVVYLKYTPAIVRLDTDTIAKMTETGELLVTSYAGFRPNVYTQIVTT